MSNSYISFNNVCKSYIVGDQEIHALKNASFNIEKGEFCVIVGQSGAGKTTLLNLLGGMDTITSGEIIVDTKHISKMNKKELSGFRRNDVGFVFQFYNLIQNLTALENVELSNEISKDPLDQFDILFKVGLIDRMNNFPSQLSGGEQQRVSIARALAKNPKILLCDEPTGALDYKTGKAILTLLKDTCQNMNKTIILITHNQAIKEIADRVIVVKSGKIVEDYYNDSPLEVKDVEW